MVDVLLAPSRINVASPVGQDMDADSGIVKQGVTLPTRSSSLRP